MYQIIISFCLLLSPTQCIEKTYTEKGTYQFGNCQNSSARIASRWLYFNRKYTFGTFRCKSLEDKT